MQLSENFTLQEFIKSQTATRLNIDNNPSEPHLENMRELATNILQPVRNHFGSIKISSGYRSKSLNKAIGGSTRSQHSKGQAADFEATLNSISNYDVATWIVENLNFDQLILEFHDADEPKSGWIHCSYNKSNNRGSILSAKKENGKTVYKQGLIG